MKEKEREAEKEKEKEKDRTYPHGRYASFPYTKLMNILSEEPKMFLRKKKYFLFQKRKRESKPFL